MDGPSLLVIVVTQVVVGYSNTEYGETDKKKMVVLLFSDVTFSVVVGEC